MTSQKSIFQDGGHGVTNLLLALVFVTSLFCEDQDLFADQILLTYLNSQLIQI